MLGGVDLLPPGRQELESLLKREQAGEEECLREQVRCARIKWPGDISAMATPVGEFPGGNKASAILIDRLIDQNRGDGAALW
ncbi:hypothetical protein Hamer_G025575 [Homarus americanus]|uniref:Uncharacterized protein n=1 Tax=Homarus americanus TaxID=6706 RepID=A0A8J5NBC1_HOMAM|nr:hypothetical protein Hamer_G025575 [Homarus americanus]